MNDARRRAELQRANEKEYRACVGKIKYPSRKNAAAVARASEKRDGLVWNEYRCGWCRRWHVGHDRFARSA